MGQVDGHPRRGHWRNGRWVRATWVRTHWRRNRGRSLSLRSEAAAQSWTASQDRSVRRRQMVAKKAQAVCTPGWQRRVTKCAVSSVDPQIWATRPVPCTQASCKALARTAKSLLRFKKVLHVIAGNAAGEVWARFRPKTFEVKLARWLVQRFPQPTDLVFIKTARCLQALGVLCCMNANRDMTKCQCLRDLAVALTMAELESQLRELAHTEAWPPALTPTQ